MSELVELKIDIDMDYKSLPAVRKKGKELAERLFFLSTFVPITPVFVSAKETTGGFHLVVQLESELPLDDKDIVFLQLLLGSDWRREVFNFRRIHEQVFKDNWNVLFTEKRRGGRIVSWERETDLSKELAETIIQTYRNWISMVRGD